MVYIAPMPSYLPFCFLATGNWWVAFLTLPLPQDASIALVALPENDRADPPHTVSSILNRLRDGHSDWQLRVCDVQVSSVLINFDFLPLLVAT